VQGFLFSPPIAEEDVPRFIEEASRKAQALKRLA
jgi:EAL domain-containing protein (putative c-di-GMP-specific phosphodiesterase class I)